MQGSVDAWARVRMVLPRWLVWALYVPAGLALWTLYQQSSPDFLKQFFGGGIDSGPFGEQSAEGSPITRLVLLMRIGVVGVSGLFLASTLGLVGAVAILLLWSPVTPTARLRAAAVVGLVLAAPPALLAVAYLGLSSAAQELLPAEVGGFYPTGLGASPEWLGGAALSLVLLWAFARIGWGPAPEPVEVLEAESSPPSGQQALPSAADQGVPTVPASPQSSLIPPAMPTPPDTASLGPAVPDPDLSVRGWDVRPELPPDFQAPDPGVSPFARPKPGRLPEELAAAEATDPGSDPLSVYRRPR